MLKAKRLEPICDLAGKREDEAALALAQARQQLAAKEAQLRELENYQEPPGTPASSELLRNREAFRARLAEAIRIQRQAVGEARKQIEAMRQAWLQQHQQVQMFDQLLDRSRRHEQAHADKRAQRELDEFSLRLLPTRFG